MSVNIFPRGEKATANFTGTAFVKMLVTDDDSVFNTTVYDVLFEKGARNFWHKHPGGQILLITGGVGFYQERGKQAQLLHKGDVVHIPPDVEHWHGASPDSEFTHIGICPNLHKGAVEWCGEVTEAEYRTATSK
jgi:quercetin dioxygenase-like cupin family protein